MTQGLTGETLAALAEHDAYYAFQTSSNAFWPLLAVLATFALFVLALWIYSYYVDEVEVPRPPDTKGL